MNHPRIFISDIRVLIDIYLRGEAWTPECKVCKTKTKTSRHIVKHWFVSIYLFTWNIHVTYCRAINSLEEIRGN